MSLPSAGASRFENVARDVYQSGDRINGHAVASVVGIANDADGAEIARLAGLSPIEYDRQRKAAAEKLGIREATLDAEVQRLRGETTVDDGAGETVIFRQREPWPDRVNGADVLDELARTFQKFIVLPEAAEDALALWVAMTYLADVISVAPLLAVTSPEKRCGKSNLLALLGRLTHRPLTAANIRPAALFRAVEKWKPTLLIDEADTFVREDDELRGIINSGHTRDSAFVIRTVGDEHEPRRFSTWGLKAIALIGTLPDTLADRSVLVELRRKLPSERVDKLRHAGDLEPIAKRCMRFAKDNGTAIQNAQPALPEDLHDRAADNWEPMLAIADLAGRDWPARARKAASILSGATPDGDSTKVELLRDIHRLIEGEDRAPGRFFGRTAIGSAELVDALTEDKAGRWHEYKRGKPLTQPQLARLLRAFHIVPRSVRLADSTPKGYPVDAFKDAFARYLPASRPPHRHNLINTGFVADSNAATEDGVLRSAKAPQANKNGPCGVVAVQKHESGREERF